MFGLGVPELLIILIVVLVLFGGSRLPALARSIGRAQNEFKAGQAEGDKAKEASPNATDKPSTDKPSTEK